MSKSMLSPRVGRARRAMHIGAARVEVSGSKQAGVPRLQTVSGHLGLPEFHRKPSDLLVLLLIGLRELGETKDERNRTSWTLDEILSTLFEENQEDPRTNFRAALAPDFLSAVEAAQDRVHRSNLKRMDKLAGPHQDPPSSAPLSHSLEKQRYAPEHLASDAVRAAGLVFDRADGKAFTLSGRGAAHPQSIRVQLAHPSEGLGKLTATFSPDFAGATQSRVNLIDVLFGPRFETSERGPWYFGLARVPASNPIRVSIAALPAALRPSQLESPTDSNRSDLEVELSLVELEAILAKEPLLGQLWETVAFDRMPFEVKVERFRSLLQFLSQDPNELLGDELRLVRVPFALATGASCRKVSRVASLLWSKSKSWGDSHKGVGEIIITLGPMSNSPSGQPSPPVTTPVPISPSTSDATLEALTNRVKFVETPRGSRLRFDLGHIISSLIDPAVGLPFADAMVVARRIAPSLRQETVLTEEIQRLVVRCLTEGDLGEYAEKYSRHFPELKYVRMDDGSARLLSHALAREALSGVLEGFKVSSGATTDIATAVVASASRVPPESRTFSAISELARSEMLDRFRSSPTSAPYDAHAMLRRARALAKAVDRLFLLRLEESAVGSVGLLLREVVSVTLLALDRLPSKNLTDAATYLSVHIDNDREGWGRELSASKRELELISDVARFASVYEEAFKISQFEGLVASGYNVWGHRAVDCVSVLERIWQSRGSPSEPRSIRRSSKPTRRTRKSKR